jgi:hypothetical protein
MSKPCKDCAANDRDFHIIADELGLTEHTREAIVKRIRELRKLVALLEALQR